MTSRSALPDGKILFALALWTLGVSILFFRAMGWVAGAEGFPLDDPFIHLTYVKTWLADGNFNYGLSTSSLAGSTSPLYVFLAIPLFALFDDPYLTLASLAIACQIALVLTMAAFLHSWRGKITMLPAFLMSFSPIVFIYSSNGMETLLFCLSIFATAWGLASLSWRRNLFAGICAGLLVWIRPEGAVLGFLAIAMLALRTQRLGGRFQSQKGLLFAGGSALVLVLIYFAVQMSWNGKPWPNTFYSKLDFYESEKNLVAYVSGSLRILWDFAGPFSLLLALPLSRLGRPKRWLTRAYLPAAGLAAFVIYGVQMPRLIHYGRYVAPALVIAAFYASVALCEPRQALSRRASISLLLSFLLFFGLSFAPVAVELRLAWLHYVSLALGLLLLVAYLREPLWARLRRPLIGLIIACQCALLAYVGGLQAIRIKYINERQVEMAHWINANLPRDAVIVTHDVGAIGYFSERRVIDLFGLIDMDIAMQGETIMSRIPYAKAQGGNYLVVLNSWLVPDPWLQRQAPIKKRQLLHKNEDVEIPGERLYLFALENWGDVK